MAVLMRRELAQHGTRSVAFVKARIITGQPARRLLNSRMEEEPNPSTKSRGKANLLAKVEKQRPNTLTPWCLRWSHQQRW